MKRDSQGMKQVAGQTHWSLKTDAEWALCRNSNGSAGGPGRQAHIVPKCSTNAGANALKSDRCGLHSCKPARFKTLRSTYFRARCAVASEGAHYNAQVMGQGQARLKNRRPDRCGVVRDGARVGAEPGAAAAPHGARQRAPYPRSAQRQGRERGTRAGIELCPVGTADGRHHGGHAAAVPP
jgi:hypothetical protein